MRIIFAQWPEVLYQSLVLTDLNARDRLVSYHFSRKLPDPFMEKYVKKGSGPDRVKQPKESD